MLHIPGQEQPCPFPYERASYPCADHRSREPVASSGGWPLPVADGLQVLTASGLHVSGVSRSIWYAVGEALTATPAVYQYNSKFNNLVGVAPRARHVADPRQVGIYFIIPAMHGPEYIL